MQLIGYDLIDYESLKFANSTDDITQNALFSFDENFIKIAKNKKFSFSIKCDTKGQAIIANAVGAKFIICKKSVAKEFSELAQFYLFDSKIACIIDNKNELNELAELGVDVAIFKKGIENGNF